jgi:uncharacterized protein
MTEPSDNSDTTKDRDIAGPVTVIVSRKVRPGREKDFETWVEGIGQAARAYPGFLLEHIHAPQVPGSRDYVVIFTFETYEHLEAWETSDERAAWYRKLRPMIEDERLHTLTGLETWFQIPGESSLPAPARYKMVAASFLAIYPLVLGADFVVGPVLGHWPLAGQLLVTSPLICALMTYAAMPLMSRLLRPWLYPRTRKDHRSHA